MRLSQLRTRGKQASLCPTKALTSPGIKNNCTIGKLSRKAVPFAILFAVPFTVPPVWLALWREFSGREDIRRRYPAVSNSRYCSQALDGLGGTLPLPKADALLKMPEA